MSSTTTPQPLPEQLPQRPNGGKGKLVAIGAAAVAALLVGGIALKACSNDSADESSNAAGGKLTTIKVGTTEASQPYWNELVKVSKEKYGLDVKTTNFSDYTQANPALAQGQIDVNLFQHLQFLGNYNVTAKQNLQPVGSTYIVPLALYSKKHTVANEIPKGGKVVIPNDPVNQARALLLLQSAGLISLKGGGNSLSTPSEIDAAKSKVTVTPVDASQTAASLDSVDAAVVNNDRASDAKLDPSKALAKDDPKSGAAKPYINVVVARQGEESKDAYKKFVEAYHEASVQKLVNEQSKGSSVEVKSSQEELKQILSKVQQDVKAKQ